VRVDLVEAAVGLLAIGDVVEDVELGLGPEERRVGDARVAQVPLGLARDLARVARVPLARHRVAHVADHRERRLLVERVDERRGRIGHEQHVRLADLLEAADRRAVEPDPAGQEVLLELTRGDREVLPRARQVGELQVDERHPVLAGEGDDLLRARRLARPQGRCRRARAAGGFGHRHARPPFS
jgi:hypothetical protein